MFVCLCRVFYHSFARRAGVRLRVTDGQGNSFFASRGKVIPFLFNHCTMYIQAVFRRVWKSAFNSSFLVFVRICRSYLFAYVEFLRTLWVFLLLMVYPQVSSR